MIEIVVICFHSFYIVISENSKDKKWESKCENRKKAGIVNSTETALYQYLKFAYWAIHHKNIVLVTCSERHFTLLQK